MANRSPDYQLHAKNKETGRKARVGAGWLEADGRISLRIDVFSVLNGSDNDMMLSLFPVNERDRQRWAKLREANKAAGHDEDGESTPF